MNVVVTQVTNLTASLNRRWEEEDRRWAAVQYRWEVEDRASNFTLGVVEAMRSHSASFHSMVNTYQRNGWLAFVMQVLQLLMAPAVSLAIISAVRQGGMCWGQKIAALIIAILLSPHIAALFLSLWWATSTWKWCRGKWGGAALAGEDAGADVNPPNPPAEGEGWSLNPIRWIWRQPAPAPAAPEEQ